MGQKRMWLFFIVFVLATVVWFTAHALRLVSLYYNLSNETISEAIEWSVKSEAEDRYVLKAHFIYFVEGKLYRGETTSSSEKFRNRWAAEAAKEKYSKKNWIVWYSPNNYELSTIQKSFPFKECFSVVILWGLLAYFVGLGYYVNKKIKNPRVLRKR